MSGVLLVDDEIRFLEATSETLRGRGHSVTTANCLAAARKALRNAEAQLVVLDLMLPDGNGLELLDDLTEYPDARVALITGHPSIKSHIQSLTGPAVTYLTKPIDVRDILRLIEDDEEFPEPEEGNEKHFGFLLGEAPAMQKVYEAIRRFGPTDVTVLIEGESGTGKELVAAAIHRLSARASGPFITVNCGAVPSDLLESEFFGHLRGAFSGAVADTLGLFRSAHGGTIFLDEIAELPPALQVKLLRVLQEKEVRPVGSTRSYSVDTRVIAATNKNLEAAIKDGSLRQDLFYRLNVVRLHVPPLRERKADIPALVTAFIRMFNQRFDREIKGIAPDAMAALHAYEFPGNVRELENLVERAYALGAREQIRLADLPALGGSVREEVAAAPAVLTGRAGTVPTLAQAERELILRALELHRNDRAKAARALGLSSRTLYRRLKEYGIS
jgi:DNA-binding NtrC family response regulator